MSIIEEALRKAGLEEVNSNANLGTVETFASRPVNKINIPEITDINCTFVYNYFTKDERIRPDSVNDRERILSLDSSDTEEIFFRVTNKKLARFVKIEFKPPSVSPDFYDPNININSSDIDFNDIVNNIVVEGATPSQVFTGTEIIDTGKESRIYEMLNGSMYFIDVPIDRESNIGAVSKLYEVLDEKGGLKGQDKKILRECFQNITPKGYKLSRTDVSPEIAKSSFDPLGKQTFSVQFNNLLMAEVVQSATIIPDNVFQDEIRSMKTFSSDVRKSTLLNIPPANTFREADYDLQVKAASATALPERDLTLEEAQDKYPDYPEIKFVGYLIEKYEVLPNETTQFLGRRYLSDHNSYFSIDDDIRYGGAYFYKIRTVCRIKFVGTIENPDNQSLNQVGLITCFMASEGVIGNVYCEESIPPPPPQSVRARFDFETLLPKIYWHMPFNKQRDIKRFQIFKRLSVNQPFKLLKEYNFDNGLIKGVSPEIIPPEDIVFLNKPRTIFMDTSHKAGEAPIYAIACVDAHGLTSNFSAQIMVQRDYLTNKVKQTIISREGAPKPYPNLYLNTDTFQDAIKTSKYDRIKLIFDPEYYDVVHTVFDSARDRKNNISTEKSLNFLAIDQNNFRYKFHFINIDNQKDETVNVKLSSKASPAGVDEDLFQVSAADFSENNISFQYGVE